MSCCREYYWRPSNQSYGTGDGLSYENAFRHDAQVNAAMSDGDTLWVCGLHDNGYRDYGLYFNGREDISIRFDYEDDPGSVIACGYKVTPDLHAGWTDLGGGVWERKIGGGIYNILDAHGGWAVSEDEMPTEPRSYWRGGAQLLRCNFGTCPPWTVYTNGGGSVVKVISCNGVVVQDMRAENTPRPLEIRDSEYVEVKGGKFGHHTTGGITLHGNTLDVTIDGAEIHHGGNGIYLITSGAAHAPEQHIGCTITNCDIYEMRGGGDNHCIGVQTASDLVIQGNSCRDSDGWCIATYWWAKEHVNRNHLIEGNLLQRIGLGDPPGVPGGISLGSSNGPVSENQRTGIVVRNNHLSQVSGYQMYLKGNRGFAADEWPISAYDNTGSGEIEMMNVDPNCEAKTYVANNEGMTYRYRVAPAPTCR